MMILLLNLKLLAAGIIGLYISLWAKNRSQAQKAALSNVEYGGFRQFWRDDRPTILTTLAAILLLFLFLGSGLNPETWADANKQIDFLGGWVTVTKRFIIEAILVALFSTCGYTGMDLALRFFGVTNRKINQVIDAKTTTADEATGNLNNPTPLK